jgi:DNA-binding transcriptional MerR regulator
MPPSVTSQLTLTVGQIAGILVHVGCAPDMAGTTERLRHWTREGFLKPVADHHEGTGKHRRYAPDAVLDALVLNAFADLGIQIAAKRHLITDALAQAKHAKVEWAHSGTKGPFALVIRYRMGKSDRGWGLTKIESSAGTVKDDPADTLTIKINLSKIFEMMNSVGPLVLTFAALSGLGSPVEKNDAPQVNLMDELRRSIDRDERKEVETETIPEDKRRRAK